MHRLPTPDQLLQVMEGIAGLGELGLPELGRMAGGMPDPSFVNLLLQNPAIMQMMQSLLSNPQFMNQVFFF